MTAKDLPARAKALLALSANSLMEQTELRANRKRAGGPDEDIADVGDVYIWAMTWLLVFSAVAAVFAFWSPPPLLRAILFSLGMIFILTTGVLGLAFRGHGELSTDHGKELTAVGYMYGGLAWGAATTVTFAALINRTV